jgi:DnaJ family protein C protein 28
MTSRLSSLLQASPKPLISGRYSHNFPGTCAENHQCASAKLFADAEQEEAEARNSTGKPSISQIPQLQSQDENWTGDESIRDAVLRMLVDKYKPMRAGPLKTAETKLREAPPKVYTEAYRVDSVERSAQTWQEIANKPLLPSVEGHKPWHTTYKVPSHTSASIKFGNLAPASESAPGVVDKGIKKTERVLAKRKEQAERLTRARESTLDYRLGLKNGDRQLAARANPVSMKGWQALVEDKIQVGFVARC